MEKSTQDKLNDEIHKSQEEKLQIIPMIIITEIITVFRNIDSEMDPILGTLLYAMEHLENEKVRTVLFYKIMNFYGLVGDFDILKVRQKYSLVSGTKNLQKRPFLKEKDKKCINILLLEHNII